MDLFFNGKFSLMSHPAKLLILAISGLPHKEAVPGEKKWITDARIAALDKDPILKLIWESYLGVQLSAEDELLTAPSKSPSTVIDLSTYKKGSS